MAIDDYMLVIDKKSSQINQSTLTEWNSYVEVCLWNNQLKYNGEIRPKPFFWS